MDGDSHSIGDIRWVLQKLLSEGHFRVEGLGFGVWRSGLTFRALP